jgi:hypothetical protein
LQRTGALGSVQGIGTCKGACVLGLYAPQWRVSNVPKREWREQDVRIRNKLIIYRLKMQ